jgi:hypothetical protein
MAKAARRATLAHDEKLLKKSPFWSVGPESL